MERCKQELRYNFEQLSNSYPAALLLEGAHGHSAVFEARELAEIIIRSSGGGTIRAIEKPADKTVIGIDQIQSLYRGTRSKQSQGRDVWIIEEAQLLSESAQNAFLKLLEEPPRSVVFILATTSASALLSTIRSRCQLIRCKPFSIEAAEAWLSAESISEKAQIGQILFLAEGSWGELAHLIEDKSYRDSCLAAAAHAKQLISGNELDQIALISSVATDREKALALIKLTLRMLIVTAPQQASRPDCATRLVAFSKCYEKLLQNGNVRVQMLRALIAAQ